MDAAHASLTLAVALAGGVFAQSAARHLRLPAIVLLLVLGALFGPEGLGWVQPRSLGEGLFLIVEFGVAIILFEGGLNLEVTRLRRQEAPIRRLITVGAFVTLLGATAAVRLLLGWSWDLAFLFGSLVVVTGPTVVAPLLRDLRLQPRLKHVLEAEGVMIDPIGAILAVLVLQIVLVPSAVTVATELFGLLLRLGFGIAAGILAGLCIGWLLRNRVLVPQGHENIFTLASVVLLFHGCDQVLAHSGILAVTVAGVVVGNSDTPVDRDLREFKDQLTMMLVAMLFILLAADVQTGGVYALGWAGAGVIAALIVAVRPLGVWLSIRASELSVSERLFLAWVAPRGIVAAAIASLTAAAMEAKGLAGGAELRALVFLTIAGTVLLAGLTAQPVAGLLKLRLPKRDRVAILGIRPLSLAFGTELREHGQDVIFLDSDPYRCREAEEAGFTVVFGDALQERNLLRAQFELVGTAIGLTSNEHLNSLFVSNSKELFKVPNLYVTLERQRTKELPDPVKRIEGDVLFEATHDIRRWDLRFRQNDATIDRFEFRRPEGMAGERGPKADQDQGPSRPQEQFVILAIKRKEQVYPMVQGLEPADGDVASIAISGADREEALRVLSGRGWHPVPTLVEAP